MNVFLNYLQQHIRGEVSDSRDARRYFAYDGSIFTKTPKVIIYPRDTADVRKAMLFIWQLAQKNKRLPVTARGLGTNHTGAALSDGALLVMPAHMDRLLKVDVGKSTFSAQPGLNYRNLQDTLISFNRYLPCYPNNTSQATLGGTIADNAGGERSGKYGRTLDYVNEMTVVLANGEQIIAKPLSHKQMLKKKTEKSLEGRIYREIDQLIEDNANVIGGLIGRLGSTGYAIEEVKRDGKFSLLPLLVGSQGSLAITTQITMKAAKYRDDSSLAVVNLQDSSQIDQIADAINGTKPSVFEFMDASVIESIRRTSPSYMDSAGADGDVLLIVEYDERNKASRARKIAKLRRIAQKYGGQVHATEDEYQQDDVWRLLSASTSTYWSDNEGMVGAPVVEDAVVPLDRMTEYLRLVDSLRDQMRIDISVWGSLGSGNMHAQPLLDASQPKHRKALAQLMDAYYRGVIALGGSVSGEYNEGMLRTPFAEAELGSEAALIMRKIKHIFDPYNLINPGVKNNAPLETQFQYVSSDFVVRRGFDYLPYL